MLRQTTLNSMATAQKENPARLTGNSTTSNTQNNINTDSNTTATDTKERIARAFFASKTSILGANPLETREDIYNIVLKAMRLLKKDMDTVAKMAEHGIALLRKMDEQRMQEETVEKVTKIVELSIAKLNIPKQIQQQLLQVNDRINQKLESMITTIYGAGNKTMGKTSTYNDGGSYVEGNEAGKKLAKMEPNKVLQLLNKTLVDMGALNKGTFVTVNKLKDSDNFLTEMRSPAITSWLRLTPQALQFMLLTDKVIKVANRDNEIILHFVPISFNPENDHEIRLLEEINDLPSCCITKMRWAKAVHRRAKGQRVASLLVHLNDVNTANKLLLSGAIVSNKRVEATKTMKEEIQCFKCQCFRHTTERCPEGDKITCGECKKRHCINCGINGYASTDRDCPAFQRWCKSLNQRMPTNQLPFFPSDEEWTWLEEPTNNTPNARPRVTYRNRGQTELETPKRVQNGISYTYIKTPPRRWGTTAKRHPGEQETV
ncbi:hypothetical protein GGU10DRAFT_336854 [Lentinula aff. detonsa]|uniref:Uncharacterized protein n=1 Tax=Lentinula aff. detonsa TaxID=2804958 RepID=A0AA38KNJ4_9AGAR|nr:hypothetical protein GGU10DRAFT_336854 [Lentinula aff. detonsa]